MMSTIARSLHSLSIRFSPGLPGMLRRPAVPIAAPTGFLLLRGNNSPTASARCVGRPLLSVVSFPAKVGGHCQTDMRA